MVVSDYRMPRFDAPEALKLAREADSRAPFVVVSGKIGEEAAVEAMKAGAHDYVMKDNLARLCATVERGLDEARRERERRETAEELRRRDAILDAVRFAAERLLGEPGGWEESVRAVLRRLGEATEASRVYVFENYVGRTASGGTPAPQVGGAGKEPVSAQMDGSPVQAIPYGTTAPGWRDFSAGRRCSGRGEPVYGNTREFPERASGRISPGSRASSPWCSCRSSSRGGGGALSGSTSAGRSASGRRPRWGR